MGKDIKTSPNIDDLECILNLFHKTLLIFNKDQDVNYPYTNNGVNYLKTRISDGFCFVAELNNDVIGFVTGALM